MKKKKKLTLSRETLLALSDRQMAPVAGGSGCPTCADQTCGSCFGSCFVGCTGDCSYSCGSGTCEPNTCPCN